MKILVTNDDGIRAQGIGILVDFLKKRFPNDEILVVAPSSEMSAVSQKLTLRKGLEVKKENIFEGINAYSVSGTPTDCVKIALVLLKYKPDIVFSGINKGYNSGNDILYSGTISACFEAGLENILGIALSCSMHSFDGVRYLDNIFDYLEENNYFPGTKIININIPIEPKTIGITYQGVLPFVSSYEKKEDGLYYLEGHPFLESGLKDKESDVYAINNHQVSISFLTPNRTDIKMYDKYKNK